MNIESGFIISVLFLFAIAKVNAKIDAAELKCLVCKTSLEEMSKAVKKIDPTKVVDVGGYRLDSDGNYVHKAVPQSKSELHLMELAEEVCPKMDDYVRATWKSNGNLMLLKFLTDDGKMNSVMSDVDIVQDDDLNKSLKYYCEEIFEEQEENIIKHFQLNSEDIQNKVCVEDSNICAPSIGPRHKNEL